MHLRLSEAIFWCSTHRKIIELLEIDKEVNSVATNTKKTKAPKGSKKMTLQEAMKIL